LRLARTKKLPCVQLPDGEIRFEEAAILALLETLKRMPAESARFNESLTQSEVAHG
jgi:hypothetical protein